MPTTPAPARAGLVTRVRRWSRHGRWRDVLHNGPLLTALVLAVTILFQIVYVIPGFPRKLAATLLHEDSVVELTTFLALAVAFVLALRLTLQLRRDGHPRYVWVFMLCFTVGLFVVGMEEISWGQWLFFWKTPEGWKELNRQGETNLHNLGGLWGSSEYMRLTYAVGGLVGVLANRRRELRPIATPMVLTGWFVVMTGYILLDLSDDLFHVPWIITTFSSMSEFVEMLIGLSAVAYFILKREQLIGPPEPGP